MEAYCPICGLKLEKVDVTIAKENYVGKKIEYKSEWRCPVHGYIAEPVDEEGNPLEDGVGKK